MKKIVLLMISLVFYFAGISQTILVLQPGATDGKDAFIPTLNPNTNYGNNAGFICAAWTYGGSFGSSRSIVQFDLSSVPAGATITSAKLSLYKDPTQSHVGHSGDNGAWLKRVLVDWNENTITYNNQPSTTTLHQVSLAPSSNSSQDYPDIDVTQLVLDMISNPAQSFGFMLQLKSEQIFRSLIFASSDHLNPTKRPKLVITYTLTCETITGNLSYANNASTPLGGIQVYLVNSASVKTDSTFTDLQGDFSLNACGSGFYTVVPHGVAQEHGINSSDALIAMKYFVGMLNLEGMFLQAADVDNNGAVNTMDGQLIVHRFIGRIHTFPAGDWIFDEPAFTLPGSGPFNFNIKGLCTGDLNASWYQ